MPELLQNKRTGEYGYRTESGEVIPAEVARNKTTGEIGWRPKGSNDPWQPYTPPQSEPEMGMGQRALRAAEFGARGFLDRASDVVGAIPELAASGLRAVDPRLAPPEGYYPEAIKSGVRAAGEFVSQPLNALVEFGPGEPQSTLERGAYGAGRGVADAASFMAPGALAARLAPAGSLTGRVGQAMTTQPVMQAVAGATGGGVSEATGSELAGLGAALAVPVGIAAAGRAITPFPSQLSPNEARLAATAERAGIRLTPGQKTGSEPLRTMESVFTQTPFTGKTQGEIYDAQRRAFNRAVLSKAGINADDASPEVIDDAFRTIGREFDDLARATTVRVDPQFINDVAGVQSQYGRRLPTDVAPVFQSYMDDLSALARNIQNKPEIAGREYQKISSDIKRAARRATNNPDLQDALYSLSRAIDDNLERSAGPELRALWQDVRNRYRNLLTIDKAMQGGTAGSRAEANIPFAGLRSAVMQGDRTGYARGRGDLNEMSRVGDFLASAIPPDSGTARRTYMQNMMSGAVPTVGGGAGGYVLGGGDPLTALLAGAGALAGPKIAQTAYQTPIMQRYLTNQMNPTGRLARELLGSIATAQQLGAGGQ